jgi:hypothetical protein
LFEVYEILKETDQHTMSTIIALRGGEGENDAARAPGFFMVLQKKTSD